MTGLVEDCYLRLWTSRYQERSDLISVSNDCRKRKEDDDDNDDDVGSKEGVLKERERGVGSGSRMKKCNFPIGSTLTTQVRS